MKIKLFIVTYNNKEDLHQTLSSLVDNSTLPLEIKVINNHSNFCLHSKFNDIEVLNNVLRPDFSTGYLSRNWNQALILGFENLINPKSDIVITCQDDTIFYPNWANNIVELHKKYSFITYGWGDNFMSWTPEGVKQIGLWDESFQMSGHTSDYFLRALLYNKNKSSINDYYHNRILNEEKIKIADRLGTIKEHKEERNFNYPYGLRMIQYKWGKIIGCSPMLTNWEETLINNNLIRPKCKNRIMYPYFEKDILTLKEQNYIY